MQLRITQEAILRALAYPEIDRHVQAQVLESDLKPKKGARSVDTWTESKTTLFHAQQRRIEPEIDEHVQTQVCDGRLKPSAQQV